MTPLYEAHAPDFRNIGRMLTLEVGEVDGRITVGLKRTDSANSHRMCLIDVEEARRLVTALGDAIARAVAQGQ